MEFFANNIIITIFLPLWVIGFILSSVIFKISGNRKLTTLLTVLSTLICGLFCGFALHLKNLPIEKNISWLNIGDLNLYLGTLLDNNAILFLLILCTVSALVQLYSYGYMKNKEEFSRYYIYLNFFNFSMAGLLLSSNIIQMYIFWELVGIASYLLIGFFHREENVSKSAKKVFFINRIGDLAFLAGIIIIAHLSISYENELGSLLLNFSNIEELKIHLIGLTSASEYNLIILLFIIGAFVKSAQFPFHTWLIDAMKAPTPVSALIHSATMVCMGIFLIIRIYHLLTPEILSILTIIGLFTALICAFVAVAQTNIKKMLAYSTSSQLGLMFLSLGLGGAEIAIFYLQIHSFTKALLFLCSGAISNAYETLDMTQMGGLKKNDFYLSLYWLVGALSLSGLFFGGFVSKEILVGFIEENQNNAILFTALLASFFTTFYIFRSYFLIFTGEKPETKQARDKSMSIALALLTIFIIIPIMLAFTIHYSAICAIAILINLFAMLTAYFSYKCNKIPLQKNLLIFAEKELFLPIIYEKIGNFFLVLCNIVNLFDKFVINNFVELTAKISQSISQKISKLQNGNIQSYISYSIFIIAMIFILLLFIYLMALRG